MSIIRILTEQVASQIAAGEIIERPASVVRELIDNSIDAGADQIDIWIERGGKGLIRVKDNGSGMGRDDLLLCIERHATSKISTASDLFSVRTLGFRGEAIPSISAVSRLQITSHPPDQMSGHRLKIDGGKLKSIDETGSPLGTSIEVRDLFFNLPARRKFLRSVKTETDHIIDSCSRILLPFNHIQFRLSDGAKILLNLPASEDQISRLSVLFGRQTAKAMKKTLYETGDFSVRAYISPADLTRSRGDRIFLYVNNRNIRDKLLLRAVMEGYGQRLMKGRYPHIVLFLEIDPSLVDVNVHPTKQELRFRNGQAVFQAIVSTIEKSLGEQASPLIHSGHQQGGVKDIQRGGVAEPEPEWTYSERDPASEPLSEPFMEQKKIVKEMPQILGQLKKTYILCQVEDGLLMIDQHAAHERIVYETLKRSYRTSKIESQYFLIPQQMEMSLRDGRFILKSIDQLKRLGVEIEHFGGNTFLGRSIPTLLVNVQLKDLLSDIIPIIEEEGGITGERALDSLFTTMACHGAIRAGQHLSQIEMVQLIEELETMDLVTNCPHGRPVVKKFNYYDIEKMFKRVV